VDPNAKGGGGGATKRHGARAASTDTVSGSRTSNASSVVL
jgi:hypothetical protein